ncbi:MAG: hypothetical protein J0H63_10790, partial [Rhizobiales bacterium]|nr:hypothetical protein [Hyphomicrobiales bacterium]
MSMIKSATIAVAISALAGGSALAASSAISAMTPSEQQSWQKCQAMSQSAMNSNQDCMSLLDRYPNLNPRGNNNGTTGSISNGTGGTVGTGTGGTGGSVGAGGSAGGS